MEDINQAENYSNLLHVFTSFHPQLPVADPFLEKVNLSDLGE